MGILEPEVLASEGPYSESVMQGLRIALMRYAQQGECLYIGISGDVDKRSQQGHSRYPWTRMVCIHNTTKRDDARKIEQKLIRHLRESRLHAYKCLNRSMGGELQDFYTHYYIYILIGPPSVRDAFWGPR